jgi:glycosyltransferase involved in cell wall biosynthesis
MSKKKILLVGDGNHQFITNYSKWLNKSKSLQNFEIDILSYTLVCSESKEFYNDIFTVIKNNIIYKILSKIKVIRKYYRRFLFSNIISKLPTYDVIHFHFFNLDSYYICQKLSKTTNSKIIITIWGSDLYRIALKNSIKFKNACNNADILTFANEKSIEYFKYKYNWGKENLKLCRFGLAPLENLKKLSQNKESCKQELKWNLNKIAITIGYNMAPEQQHLEILDEFLDKKITKLKDKIQLILPITYGGSPKYKDVLLKKISSLPFEYKVYDTYLNDEVVAKIRKSTDIMIQLQKTDQFSGSMQEHLHAKNIIITGAWLPYETLKENKCWFIEIDKIAEIDNLILNILDNFKELEAKTNNNPQAIEKLSSWDINIKDWISLYND